MSAVTVNLTSSTVSGNSAGTAGGGIFAGTLNLTNSTVSGNSAVTNGGGIAAGTATLTNGTIVENIAQAALRRGSTTRAGRSSSRTHSSLSTWSCSALARTWPPFTSSGHNLIGDGSGGGGSPTAPTATWWER